jgi:vacuolar-type H+-ATPase subunit I/STV1
MSKDPAVLFYTSDFLSGTFTMSNEQVGKYIRLLCLQHQKGKLTEKDMLSICKAYDDEIWCKFIKEDGVFYNERMYNETVRRQKFSESRRNNAKSPKNDSTSKAYAQHMETETETINETINRTKTKTEILDTKFEDWWLWYDYKISKDKAKSSWKKLTEQEKYLALQSVQSYVEATPDKSFRKHPTTYLNQKSFNDEIIKRNNNITTKVAPKVTAEQLYEAHTKFFGERR